jgi:hypothetical protein
MGNWSSPSLLERIISGVLGVSWIDNVNPAIRNEIIEAKRDGAKVKYNVAANTVSVNWGPLALRVYDAETGALIMMS